MSAETEWEQAKELLEAEEVSLKEEGERAIIVARKTVDAREELHGFMSGLSFACSTAADLFNPNNGNYWDRMNYRFRDFKVRFQSQQDFHGNPSLKIKKRGRTLIHFTFAFDKKLKKRVPVEIYCIDYNRMSELSELITSLNESISNLGKVLKKRGS